MRCIVYSRRSTRKIQTVNLLTHSGNKTIEERTFDDPKAIEVGHSNIYILDRNIIQVIDKISYQTKQVIDVGPHAGYLARDRKGSLFVFDTREKQIYKIRLEGAEKKIPLLNDSGKAHIPNPDGTGRKVLGMTIGSKHDRIYVLTSHTIEIFNSKGNFEKRTDLVGIEGLQPSSVAVDNDGNIFVGNIGSSEFISPIRIDNATDGVTSIAYQGRSDQLFFSRTARHDHLLYIINLSSKDKQSLAKENCIDLMKKSRKFSSTGAYVSTPLDSQTLGLKWHKFGLYSNIPNNTSVELSYYASDSADDKPVDTMWKKVPPNPHDVLINTIGRYLWFRLDLYSQDNMNTTPRISEHKGILSQAFISTLPARYISSRSNKQRVPGKISFTL